MHKVDCFGDFCPVPLLKAQEITKNMHSGETFMLVTDHSCTVESILDYYKNTDIFVDIDEVINGVWEITFSR